jgi:hypothetical protein
MASYLKVIDTLQMPMGKQFSLVMIFQRVHFKQHLTTNDETTEILSLAAVKMDICAPHTCHKAFDSFHKQLKAM